MKNKFLFYILCVSMCGILSCKKDNYTPPSSQLNGALTYKGDTIRVEYNRVSFQLYQFGFGKVGPIGGTFSQNGTMNMVLFAGNYKFIIPNGQGPFLWKKTPAGDPDTLNISLAGSKNLNIEVMPYYMIRNAAFSGGGGTVKATCKVEKIITDANAKAIERVTLYINNTAFVSGANNVASASISGAAITDPNNISLSVAVPSGLGQNFVQARIGVKIAGVEALIFSPIMIVTY